MGKGIGFGSTLGDTGVTAKPDFALPGKAATTFAAPAPKKDGGGPGTNAGTVPSAAAAVTPARSQAISKQPAATPSEDRKQAFTGGAAAAKPKPAAARLSFGGGPKCPVCSKSVGAAEEVKAIGRSWHASCFCCKACGKSLRGGNYKEHEGAPYCSADYGKLFGPKGFGYGNTLCDTGITEKIDS